MPRGIMGKRGPITAPLLARPDRTAQVLYRTLRSAVWPLAVAVIYLVFSPGITPLLAADCDGDGLTDSKERSIGTHECRADTDEDGLNDHFEVKGDIRLTRPVRVVTTDPLNPDTDGDGLKDGEEVLGESYETWPPQKAYITVNGEQRLAHSDPTDSDSDDDGLPDGDEVRRYKTDPTEVDTDGDGLSDPNELRGVRVTVLGEDLRIATEPTQRDTDSDGLTDGEEVNPPSGRVQTNPIDPDRLTR